MADRAAVEALAELLEDAWQDTAIDEMRRITSLYPNEPHPGRRIRMIDLARGAITRLHARGYRLVPKEAEADQIRAAREELKKLDETLATISIRRLYRIMVAAPGAPKKEEGA